jgi:hypothetical protein
MRINDIQGFRAYAEHTTDVDVGFKAVPQGYVITDQDTDGNYTTESNGDEGGWVFHEANTRPLGLWTHCMVYEATDDLGTISPIADGDLNLDTTLAEKTVVTTDCGGDLTKCRSIISEIPKTGDRGLVVQAAHMDDYDYLWIPIVLM